MPRPPVVTSSTRAGTARAASHRGHSGRGVQSVACCRGSGCKRVCDAVRQHGGRTKTSSGEPPAHANEDVEANRSRAAAIGVGRQSFAAVTWGALGQSSAGPRGPPAAQQAQAGSGRLLGGALAKRDSISSCRGGGCVSVFVWPAKTELCKCPVGPVAGWLARTLCCTRPPPKARQATSGGSACVACPIRNLLLPLPTLHPTAHDPPPPSSGSASSSLARPVQQSSRHGERSARPSPHRLLW